MGGGLVMKEMDLIELYQLLNLYRRTYRETGNKNLEGILTDIEGKYREYCRGADIRDARNPRGAGRRRQYTIEQDERVKNLCRSGMSMREVAKAVGCSVGHVQDVLHPKAVERPWMYGNQ